jgi:hypothetical protein
MIFYVYSFRLDSNIPSWKDLLSCCIMPRQNSDAWFDHTLPFDVAFQNFTQNHLSPDYSVVSIYCTECNVNHYAVLLPSANFFLTLTFSKKWITSLPEVFTPYTKNFNQVINVTKWVSNRKISGLNLKSSFFIIRTRQRPMLLTPARFPRVVCSPSACVMRPDVTFVNFICIVNITQ